MKYLPIAALAVALVACDYNPVADDAVTAARQFTQLYAKQTLKASAAGSDCLVLLIRTETAIDRAIVESIHYGTGDYSSYDGGADEFAEARRFRAVVYRDFGGELWTYGSITRSEAASLPVCR